MKSFKLLFFFVLLVVVECTPPEEVRLINYTEAPGNGLFARIPVCYSPNPLQLGDSFSEFSEYSGLSDPIHSIETNDGIVKKEYKPVNRRDTLLTCTFKEGRLIEVLSSTKLSQDFELAEDALLSLADEYPCLGDLGKWMDEQGKNCFTRHNDAFTEGFYLNQTNRGYTNFCYRIAYFDHFKSDGSTTL
jgi:hypothetical protein